MNVAMLFSIEGVAGQKVDTFFRFFNNVVIFSSEAASVYVFTNINISHHNLKKIFFQAQFLQMERLDKIT